jgi:gluconolactonase
VILVLGGVLASLAAATPATAASNCFNAPQAHVLFSGYGILESVIVDEQGRLYFTDTANDQILRANAPGDTPVPYATGIPELGGMAFDPMTGDLLVGSGDSIATGTQGNLGNYQAKIMRIDKTTQTVTTYASGLKMSNGVVVTGDGTLFASSDVAVDGDGIDRVGPGGAPVEPGWADVASANGLVIDSTGQFLYADQTFQPAAIKRVRLSDPSQIDTFVQAAPADLAAGLDGITRDENDNLYAAANSGGQIWKITNPGREICALANMAPFPSGPSAVAFGQGSSGFSSANLYAVTFGGEVIELPNARAATPTPPATASPDAIYGLPGAKRKCRKRHRKKKAHASKRKHCKRKHRKKR